MEYLVKWEGYKLSECSWEPEENLLDNDVLQEFKRKELPRSFYEVDEATLAARLPRPWPQRSGYPACYREGRPATHILAVCFA
jgi:hypothetical protein